MLSPESGWELILFTPPQTMIDSLGKKILSHLDDFKTRNSKAKIISTANAAVISPLEVKDKVTGEFKKTALNFKFFLELNDTKLPSYIPRHSFVMTEGQQKMMNENRSNKFASSSKGTYHAYSRKRKDTDDSDDVEFRTPAQERFSKSRRESSSGRSSRRESPTRTPDIRTPDISNLDNDQLRLMLTKIQDKINDK